MFRRRLSMTTLLLAAILALWSPTKAQDQSAAVAVVRATSSSTHEWGEPMGYVWFTPSPTGGTTVEAKIWGLEPNSRHGFHIHQWGDSTQRDARSAGGHYAPRGHEHGSPEAAEKHVGDLGNLVSDAHGKAHYRETLERLRIDGEFSILGRAIIIHKEPDTFGQPTGNAGSRIGCGVIGRTKPEGASLSPADVSLKKVDSKE